MAKRFLSLVLLAALAGCVFVQPTVEGKKVRVLTAGEVERCRLVSTLTAQVTDRIGNIPRSREAVEDDVLQHAKNEAAVLGGDTIVAVSELAEGRQTFNVYSCLKP
ncbi:hypothetical protein SVA_2276 [Sulfurifustis variabilis]|uniref:Lipoprotein n=1 Tax=Sulfurifustis variabilis TaxID=1675686 RepID=A0A1B4V5L0_9GAMM|nr:DUF4156 domain-containing protein [Sulfurifustis variabilis]BAU48826.1 hypothetical protein SVA_2276 [Sulfurifustis variabilis]